MHNGKKTIAIAITCAAMLLSGGHAGAAAYDAAAYLSAYQAAKFGDIDGALNFYTDALRRDPGNPELLERSFRASYIAGEISGAAGIVDALPAGMRLGHRYEPQAAMAAKAADWNTLARLAPRITDDAMAFGVLLDAWAGLFRKKAARQSFLRRGGRGDENGPPRLPRPVIPGGDALPGSVAAAQLALMHEYTGRESDARLLALEAIAALATGGRRGESDGDTAIHITLTMAGVLARNGAAGEAAAVLRRIPRLDFAWNGIAAAIDDGTSPLLAPPDEATLIALAATHIALAAQDGAAQRIMRLRFAAHIAPDAMGVRYHLGGILRRIGDDAWEELHARIPGTSPYYRPMRIMAARHLGDEDPGRAAAIYASLIAADKANPYLHLLAGDQARRQKQYDTAIGHYDAALASGGDGGQLHFFRGIAFDMLGRDAETEAAFRASLAHNPDDAQTLNYLGYWMLEHGGNIAEALGMIKKAVRREPDNGAFVDSLGWGYFRLGRYAEALPFLERAAMLEPTDPVITDHLGDTYARLGRLREARYEWRRALDFANEDTDTAAIRAKLVDAESRPAR